MKIEIKHRCTSNVLWSGEAENLKEGLQIAVKSGANLSGADLSRAYLSGAKNYRQSHAVLAQVCRNKLTKFTVRQQEQIFRIVGLSLCWNSIKKEYGKTIRKTFKVFADNGFDEFLKEWDSRFSKKATVEGE